MAAPDLPPDLRRSANRPARPRRKPSDRLIDAAREEQLRRRNTRPGTVGRQAVDAVLYEKRAAKRAPGESVRSALGHEPISARNQSVVSILADDPPRFLILAGLTRGERRRASRYDSVVGLLVDQRISDPAFRRRVVTWRPIGGFTLLSDPEAVRAVIEERRAQDLETFVYYSGRAA